MSDNEEELRSRICDLERRLDHLCCDPGNKPNCLCEICEIWRRINHLEDLNAKSSMPPETRSTSEQSWSFDDDLGGKIDCRLSPDKSELYVNVVDCDDTYKISLRITKEGVDQLSTFLNACRTSPKHTCYFVYSIGDDDYPIAIFPVDAGKTAASVYEEAKIFSRILKGSKIRCRHDWRGRGSMPTYHETHDPEMDVK